MDDLIVLVLELDEVHALRELGNVVGFLVDVIKSLELSAHHVDHVDFGDAVTMTDLKSGGHWVGEDAEVFGRGLGRQAQAEEKKENEEGKVFHNGFNSKVR